MTKGEDVTFKHDQFMSYSATKACVCSFFSGFEAFSSKTNQDSIYTITFLPVAGVVCSGSVLGTAGSCPTVASTYEEISAK
jgi:hypothetical protein